MRRKEVSQPVYTRDMKDLADEFNIFCISVGVIAAEVSKKIAIENNLPTVQPSVLVPNNEICEIIISFPSHKAPGLDKVSVSVIKDALPIILRTRTKIVN